jgi:hypothetical protein
MAKGDDFQFRVRPAPGTGRDSKEPITDMSALESRENRDWRDCGDQLDRSEIRRITGIRWRSGLDSNSRLRLFSARTANFFYFPFSAGEPASGQLR